MSHPETLSKFVRFSSRRTRDDQTYTVEMKLTTKGRYAVMAMADLAVHGEGMAVALSEIAERQDISSAYLEQLFAKLRKSGLVRATRGRAGGFALSRPARDIRVGDIVAAVEETVRATRCAPGGGRGCMPNGARCLTHDLWDELGRHIQLFFDSITLDDVAARRVLGKSRPPVEFVLEAAAE